MTGRIMIIAGIALIAVSIVLMIYNRRHPLQYEDAVEKHAEKRIHVEGNSQNIVSYKASPSKPVETKKDASGTEDLVKTALQNAKEKASDDMADEVWKRLNS